MATAISTPDGERAGRGAAPLLTWPGVAAGAVAAVTSAAWVVETVARRGTRGLGNDFYIYWASSRVLASGGSPYDVRAVNGVLEAARLHVTVGQDGYSYPLLFSVLLLPLARMPAEAAAVTFAVASLLALAMTLALLASAMPRCRWWELLALGVLAGSFIPVRGSLFFGQANLLLLLPLALAFRGVWAGGSLGLATAVKLYPAVGLGVLLARGRRGIPEAAGGLALAAALIALPSVVLGHHMAGHLIGMLGPDTYWTNESFNGALSRLAIRSELTAPLLPGLPVLPLTLAVDAVTGAAAGLLILRHRGRPWSGCLALAVGWALLAAPKISLWDLSPLLLASAYCWPRSRRSPLRLLVLGAGWILIAAQSSVDLHRHEIYQGSPTLSLLSSLAVLGTLLIVALTATLLWSERRLIDFAHDRGPT
jgi:hypothetical protein